MRNLARRTAALLLIALPAAAQSQPAKLVIPSPAGGGFGDSLALAGDIDGDGLQDLVVGRELEGYVSVHRSTDGAVLLLLQQTATGFFGRAVAGGSDLDGDGVPDIVVSTGGFVSTSGKPAIGAYSSVGGGLLWGFGAPEAADWDGLALALIPDLNDDGTDDVVAGNRLYPPDESGRVVVLDGRTGALLHVLVGQPGSRFGQAVAGLGDLDGDGAGDFAVGAPEDQLSSSPGQGNVRLVSGRDAITLGNIKPLTFWEKGLGWDVCATGDEDGDGLPDLAVGVPLFPGFGSEDGKGAVRIHSGADKSLLLEVLGTPERPIGSWVRSGADLDADGRQDLALGVSHVRVASGADGHDLFTMVNPVQSWAPIQHHPLLHPDTDGDGAADIVVGLPQSDFMLGLVSVHGRGSEAWTALGGELAGARGAPGLDATGWLEAGQGVRFTLTGAAPGALGVLVGGLGLAEVPFHGGTLVPTPDAAWLLLTDASGAAALEVRWPLTFDAIGQAGQKLTVQAWVADATGPDGFSASGALARWIQ